ncbi:MAG: hypothetical protein KGL46_09050 [Hyphomicrobiales bacterium]|nr:hypothetical protein [Hyphomicrobiales bacterium]
MVEAMRMTGFIGAAVMSDLTTWVGVLALLFAIMTGISSFAFVTVVAEIMTFAVLKEYLAHPAGLVTGGAAMQSIAFNCISFGVICVVGFIVGRMFAKRAD